MQSRRLRQSSILAWVRVAAMFFLGIFPVLWFVGTARATGGIPWQVGDVVVCYGTGNCNVLRIHGTSVQLLDTLSDGLGGSTGGAALNNSLHPLATDDKGGGSSKVVVYSIASINPFTGAPLTHSVISTFDASSGLSPSAAAIAVSSAGHIFVGNSDPGGASIIELDAHGTPVTGSVFTFPTTGTCATTTLGSLDIGAAFDSIYVTAKDGVIRKVTLPLSSASCSQFANFGSAVNLYGIKDIPANALSGFCTGSVICPTDESVLVVATGFTDSDTVSEPPSPSDAVNICTNVADGTPVSCALLLDTNPNPGSLWQAQTHYFVLGAPILDPYLHQQTVVTAGTSGTDEPAFSQSHEPMPVIDNAVIWTDQGAPAWVADHPYAQAAFPGTYIVDSNSNLQTVTTTGISGHAQPFPWSTSGTVPTIDGLQWTDQGQSLWAPHKPYSTLGTFISDPHTHAQKVIQAGTSAFTGAQPVAGWNDAGGNTIEGVTWTESHPTWAASSLYAKTAVILDSNNHVQQVSQAGTSGTGPNPPTFNEGSTTDDNTVTWMDEGQEFWQANNVYVPNAIIIDAAGHVQEATQTGNGISGPTQPVFSDSNGPAIPDGLVWTDQGQPLSTGWQTNTSFDLHQIIVDNNTPIPHFQQVAVAGTSGSSTPAFSTTGGYTLDQGFLNPPAPPQTSSVSGGGVATDTSYYVVITYVNQYGETLPSGEVMQFVLAGNLLTVKSPPPSGTGTDAATGYNVYVSTNTGSETKQTTSPQPIGSDWTENGTGLSAGTAVPTTNTAVDSVVWIDLGPTGSWTPTTSYPVNAVVTDLIGHVQQATQAGKSGSGTQPAPKWNDCSLQTVPPGVNTCTNSVTTSDNVVLWTDEGLVGSNAAFKWQMNTPYTNGVMIVDAAHHVQEATQIASGTSSPSQPTFVDGGTVNDNTVTWTDEGQEFWQASNVYAQNAIIVDAAGHVQESTQTGNGTSGPTQPMFSDAAGPAIPDGLIWTDQGRPLGPWQANQAYFLNQIILDNNTHFQRVVVAGTSGAGPSLPAFNTSGGTTLDNTVVWLDLGQKVFWTPTTSYPINAVVTDLTGHVQQATQAGTSGSGTHPAPAWNDCTLTGSSTCTSTVTTNDNVVLWTDEGPVGSNPSFAWQPGTPYAHGAMIVDAAHHVQEATQTGAGTSGASPGPTFVDGGTVIDGLIWADQGQPQWTPSTPYSQIGTFIVDTHNNLETVAIPGISGPATPNWQASGTTIDGLIWADQGGWTPHTQYFALGAAVGDAAGHVHTVLTTGTSSATGTQPASGWKDDGTTTIDNAVTWTESHPAWAATHSYTVGNPDTLILDTNNNVQLAANNAQWTGTGISGPSQPSSAGHNPWSTTVGGTTVDGLQWTNQATPTSVAARYPVAGVSTLQPLALDPLVANCIGNICSGLPLPTRKTANFWLGDSGSGSFYKLDFATGTPITLTGACPTGCGIQSLVVYGGEGANQPGLASLVSGFTLNSGNLFTASAQFLQNTITSTLSNNGSGSPPPTPISLYASLVDKTSCFNDPLFGNLGCKPTVSANTTKALVWKFDFPVNGNAGLPTTETLNTSFATVGGFGIDNSTDVFVDEQFDDTTFVGTDPGTRSLSVHSLHEVSSVPQTTAQCTYSSPLKNVSYKNNRGTLNFIFTCPGLPQTQFQHMHPSLSLVKKNPGQSPQFIPLSGTNGKAPYRFDSSGNFWTFQWNLKGATAGTYEGTTFDSPSTPFDSPAVQSFTVTFCLSKSPCP